MFETASTDVVVFVRSRPATSPLMLTLPIRLLRPKSMPRLFAIGHLPCFPAHHHTSLGGPVKSQTAALTVYRCKMQFMSCHRGVFAAASDTAGGAGAAPASGTRRRQVVVGGRRVKTIDVHA